MSETGAVEKLKKTVSEALALMDKYLVKRPSSWGTITFEAAEKNLKRIRGILNNLNILPVENLPEGTIAQLSQHVDQVWQTLQTLDSFTVEAGQPAQQRDQIVNEIHQRAEQLYTTASQWIPFLAFERGDVQRNLDRLTESVGEANRLVEEMRDSLKAKSEEIDEIVTATREASAAAGAAVFTKDFKAKAAGLGDKAHSWLWATIVMAALTLTLATVAFFYLEEGLDTGEIIQRSTAKLAILAIFFTGTLWCGRVYKALLHQSTINRHRALSLETFQAFSHAAADDHTKDAVLLEATRAVFGVVPTGFLDGTGGGMNSPQAMQILELARRTGGTPE